jgi:hypothetical protein
MGRLWDVYGTFMGRLWDAYGIGGYRPREAGTLLVGDDLPRDDRYCDHHGPDRTRQCSDQHD